MKKVELVRANSVATRALKKLNLGDIFLENLNCRNGVGAKNMHEEHARNLLGENLANKLRRNRTQIRHFATGGIPRGVVLRKFE